MTKTEQLDRRRRGKTIASALSVARHRISYYQARFTRRFAHWFEDSYRVNRSTSILNAARKLQSGRHKSYIRHIQSPIFFDTRSSLLLTSRGVDDLNSRRLDQFAFTQRFTLNLEDKMRNGPHKNPFARPFAIIMIFAATALLPACANRYGDTTMAKNSSGEKMEKMEKSKETMAKSGETMAKPGGGTMMKSGGKY